MLCNTLWRISMVSMIRMQTLTDEKVLQHIYMSLQSIFSSQLKSVAFVRQFCVNMHVHMCVFAFYYQHRRCFNTAADSIPSERACWPISWPSFGYGLVWCTCTCERQRIKFPNCIRLECVRVVCVRKFKYSLSASVRCCDFAIENDVFD